VDVVSSGEEGAGAAPAVGQPSEVHGVKGAWVEYPRCGPRGGRSSDHGHQLGRGYKTYRNRKAVGFVPPLERPAVRQVSSRFLSQDERIERADLRHTG
jgi:hypothetical protein